MSEKLKIIPLSLEEANDLVKHLHRHHQPVQGHKFSMGVVTESGALVGAVVVGRPVARFLDNGETLEVTRCVTDGTKNARSALYGAARRATFASGFKRLIAFTLKEESGKSIIAAGWKLLGERGGGTWNCPSHPRIDKHPTLALSKKRLRNFVKLAQANKGKRKT